MPLQISVLGLLKFKEEEKVMYASGRPFKADAKVKHLYIRLSPVEYEVFLDNDQILLSADPVEAVETFNNL